MKSSDLSEGFLIASQGEGLVGQEGQGRLGQGRSWQSKLRPGVA